jgi:2,3-bisphosphoglycerate-dependent phosphoglycerate mutase
LGRGNAFAAANAGGMERMNRRKITLITENVSQTLLTSFTIVRHGETEWNQLGLHQGVQNSPLTEKGLAQAYSVARALKKFTFQKLYSSDLGRAVETAQIIGSVLNLGVIFDKRLQERNLGCLGGLTIDEFSEQYPEDCEKYLSGDPDYILPGGESIRQSYERSIACFEELAFRHQNENILIITHEFILDYLLRYTLEIPLQHRRRFVLKNCSINRFVKTEHDWKLETWGEICS